MKFLAHAAGTLPQKQEKVSLCLLQCTSWVAGLGAAKPCLLLKKRTPFFGIDGNPLAVTLVQSFLSEVLVVAAF